MSLRKLCISFKNKFWLVDRFFVCLRMNKKLNKTVPKTVFSLGLNSKPSPDFSVCQVLPGMKVRTCDQIRKRKVVSLWGLYILTDDHVMFDDNNY